MKLLAKMFVVNNVTQEVVIDEMVEVPISDQDAEKIAGALRGLGDMSDEEIEGVIYVLKHGAPPPDDPEWRVTWASQKNGPDVVL